MDQSNIQMIPVELTIYNSDPLVQSYTNIHLIGMDVDYEPTDNLLSSKNIISVQLINLEKLENKNIYTSPIALLQTIKNIKVCHYTLKTNFIWRNYFLMTNNYNQIPSEVEHINILTDVCYTNRYSLTIPFPIGIKSITINTKCVKNAIKKLLQNLSNLPVGLEKLTITFNTFSPLSYLPSFAIKPVDFIKELENKLRIPFGCSLIFDNYHIDCLL